MAVLLTVGLTAASSATAATYYVDQCRSSNPPAPDAEWYESGTARYVQTVACPAYLQAIGDGTGNGINDDGSAVWRWIAPAGTKFISVSAYGALRNADNQRTQFVVKEGAASTVLPGATGGTTTNSGTFSWSGSGQGTFQAKIWCVAAAGARCPNPSSGRAYFQIATVRLGIADSTRPVLDYVSRDLFEAGEITGQRSLAFSGTDTGSGIRESKVTVNGTLTNPQLYTCELTAGSTTIAKRLTPCVENRTHTYSFDTASAPFQEGLNTVKVCVEDFGGGDLGNETCKTKTVEVDNTPPETTIDAGPTGTTSEADAGFDFSADETSAVFECLLDGANWGSCSSPKSYSSLANGPHSFSVRAIDDKGRVDPTPATRSWSVDTTTDVGGAVLTLGLSGPLKDAAELNQPLLGASYVLTVHASAPAGIRSIEIKVDGTSRDLTTNSCLAGCDLERNWTFQKSEYEDGPHRVRVIATDLAGLTKKREFAFATDTLGDIYHVKAYTDNPAAGGDLLDEQWGKLDSVIGRAEDSERILTRSLVPCEDGEGGFCDEVRFRAKASEPSEAEDYSYDRSLRPEDPDLQVAAGYLNALHSGPGEPDEVGPLQDALAAWQDPPPGAGSQYQRYEQVVADPSEGTGTTEIWIDASTKLPLKGRFSADGEVVDTAYWTYDQNRYLESELPADFFSVQPPEGATPPGSGGGASGGGSTSSASPSEPDPGITLIPTAGDVESSDIRGAAPVGVQLDTETGSSFTPYFLGTNPTIPQAGSFCLVSSDIVRMAIDPATALSPDALPDPEFPGDDPAAPETWVEARYRALDPGEACDPDTGSTYEPALSVVSMAAQSSNGVGWLYAYRDNAEAIQADPQDDEFLRAGVIAAGGGTSEAYVVVTDELRSSALLSVGDATVIITGPFGKPQTGALTALLESL